MRFPRHLLLWASLAWLASGCGKKPEADRVFRNGAVYTVDAKRSWAEAVAIDEGRIVYVGDDAGVEAYIGPSTDVLDLQGKMLLPGFIDSHSHPSGALVQAVAVDLHSLGSLEAYLKAVGAYAKAHPDKPAIRGSGWSNALFPLTGPSKTDLDGVVSDRPVLLGSGDGHSSWANSRALEMAGITKETPDPEGGIIERDPKTGEATGTLRESAGELVSNVLPPYSVEERMTALDLFQDMASKSGVTTVRVAAVGLGNSVSEMDQEGALASFERLENEGKLHVRFRGNLLLQPTATVDDVANLVEIRDREKGGLFEIDGVKIFVDGVVEGETAYLLEPYAHRPDYRGELLWDPEHLKDIVAAADARGFLVHVHSIGDAATRLILDAFQHAREVNGVHDARYQVTHVQLVTPEDIRRFAELSVIAVPQPFWFSKGPFYTKIEVPYLGEERASHEYPMQSFFDAGVTVASASDFPVTVPFDPLSGMERGVTRSYRPDDPDMVLGPGERASLDEMIASFTINGAYASRLEKVLGSIEVGKVADLVVVDRNLFDLAPDAIGDAKVLLTLFEGAEVYRDPAL